MWPDAPPFGLGRRFHLIYVTAVQVTPCTKRFVHDWVTCPLSHPGEKAKRRDPRKSGYTGIACPAMKKVRRLYTQLPSSPKYCMTSHNLLCANVSLLLSVCVQAGMCHRGDQCPYAHNVFEYWLHPTRYAGISPLAAVSTFCVWPCGGKLKSSASCSCYNDPILRMKQRC